MAPPQVKDGAGNNAALDMLMNVVAGDKKTTTNAGDTTALNNVIGQLKGFDPNALLQSIFQQAAGQIPGLRQQMVHAAGARSGSNSAMSASLQKLLQETMLAGQQKISEQMLQNAQIQSNAGSAIAQATRGTTQQSGADVMPIAQKLAALALLQKSGILQGAKGMFGLGEDEPGKTAGKQAAASAPAPVAMPVATAANPFDGSGSPLTSAPAAPIAPIMPGSYYPGEAGGQQASAPVFQEAPVWDAGIHQPTGMTQEQYQADPMMSASDYSAAYQQPDYSQYDNLDYANFADGGEVTVQPENIFQRRARALDASTDASVSGSNDPNAAFQEALRTPLLVPVQQSIGPMSPNDPAMMPPRTSMAYQLKQLLLQKMGFGQPQAPRAGAYADGGMVSLPRGRQGQKLQTEPEEGGSEDAEDLQEAQSQARFDAGFTANRQIDALYKALGSEFAKKANGYADGGTVSIRAGGSRRSLNPSVELYKLQRSGADNQYGASPAQMSMQGGGDFGSRVAAAIPQAPSITNPLYNPDIVQAAQLHGVVNAAGTLAGQNGATMNVPYLGEAAAVASIRNGDDAQRVGTKYGTTKLASEALGKSSVPGVLGAWNVMDLAGKKKYDAAKAEALDTASYYIPVYGQMLYAANTISKAFGGPSVGTAAVQNLSDSVTPLMRRDEAALRGDVSEVMKQEEEQLYQHGKLISDTAHHWTNVASDTVSDWGTKADNAVQNAGLPSPTEAAMEPVRAVQNFFSSLGFADGGMPSRQIKGPGTGISDSIPAVVSGPAGQKPIAVSDGEFIVSKDVVDKVGVGFFDMLQKMFHTPAAMQAAAGKK